MKHEIANIRSQASAIRQHAEELAAELAALPPLNPCTDNLPDAMVAIAAELADLTGGAVNVDIRVWRHFHDWRPEGQRFETVIEYRIWLSALNEHAEGPTLELARAAAESLIRAKKSAAQAAAVA